MGKASINLKKIISILMIFIIALACRLAYIQLAGNKDLAAVTRAQSMIALKGSNTRGIIYDRNGAALVADSKKYVYIIKEDNFDLHAEDMLMQLGANEINDNNKGYFVYSSEHYNKVFGRELIKKNNAYILQASGRYSDNQLAEHLIGYVNEKDNSGAAGLELMYDEQLSALNRSVYAVADVTGNILPGRGLVITSEDQKDSFVKKGIRTTIDKEMQKAVESIIATEENDCAVVVMDVNSGGILSMACTPGFDPNNVNKYMKSQNDELLNKVTQGEYPPGSVFKIIVAAAALEAGIDVNQTFECDGVVKIGELAIGCKTGGTQGHGKIGFEDAFARSCNSYFVKLAQQIGSDCIIKTAEDFGLGKNVLKGYPQESAGHLMTEAERYGAAVGNLAIGQGETLVTPLQIAVMTNTIASGGINKGAHILMEDEKQDRHIISANTAKTIGEMMAKTTEYGTGSSLALKDSDGKPVAAVKTGTAEYGAAIDGQSHGWITGYTPCETPEYTITVFVEEGSSGAGSAGPIFAAIIKYLQESGSYSKPTLA